MRGQTKKQGLVAPYFFSTEDTPSPFKLPFKLHMHVKVRVNKVKYTWSHLQKCQKCHRAEMRSRILRTLEWSLDLIYLILHCRLHLGMWYVALAPPRAKLEIRQENILHLHSRIHYVALHVVPTSLHPTYMIRIPIFLAQRSE